MIFWITVILLWLFSGFIGWIALLWDDISRRKSIMVIDILALIGCLVLGSLLGFYNAFFNFKDTIFVEIHSWRDK